MTNLPHIKKAGFQIALSFSKLTPESVTLCPIYPPEHQPFPTLERYLQPDPQLTQGLQGFLFLQFINALADILVQFQQLIDAHVVNAHVVNAHGRWPPAVGSGGQNGMGRSAHVMGSRRTGRQGTYHREPGRRHHPQTGHHYRFLVRPKIPPGSSRRAPGLGRYTGRGKQPPLRDQVIADSSAWAGGADRWVGCVVWGY